MENHEDDELRCDKYVRDGVSWGAFQNAISSLLRRQVPTARSRLTTLAKKKTHRGLDHFGNEVARREEVLLFLRASPILPPEGNESDERTACLN